MPSLQPYKFLHCQRLLECGLANRAQDYTRELADWLAARVAAGATQVETDPVPGWVGATNYLATRLKYLDPVYTTTAGEIADIPDPEWLAKLEVAVRSLQAATTDYTMAEETMQAVMQEQYQAGQVQEQYPGWRWDGVQWVQEQEENGWSGGQQEQGAGGGGYPTLQEEYTGSLQGGEANADQDAYLRQQENYYNQQQQQQDFSSQEPYSNRQESPHQEASPEPPGGSSPEQEESPSHTVADPTPSPPEGFLGFNPSSLPPVAETPSYETNAQRASFDPATLPPPRRTSVTDPPSRPGLHRQGSLGRSRQSSTSEPPPPSLQPPSILQPPSNLQTQPPSTIPAGQLPPAPAPSEEKKEQQSSSSKEKKQAAAAQKKSSLLGSLMPGLPSWLKPKNQVHLPDDTKPSIVFNEGTGRWENTTEGEEDICAPAAPPPMMSAAPSMGPGGPGGPTGAAPMNFRAGLVGKKKGRGYVDVLSQSGMAKPMAAGSTPGLVNGIAGGGPPGALLDPSTPPAPLDGPTSLDYGGGGAPPPMMMFNPSAMGGAEQPPAF